MREPLYDSLMIWIHFHACFEIKDLTVDTSSGHVALQLTGKGGVESDGGYHDHYQYHLSNSSA